jgi:hypothetical protein
MWASNPNNPDLQRELGGPEDDFSVTAHESGLLTRVFGSGSARP